MNQINEKYIEIDHCNNMHTSKGIIYWSNACGDLHYNGEYDLKSPSELPFELQHAYRKLWEENSLLLEYLTEYNGKYFIAIIRELDEFDANNRGLSMDLLYENAKNDALKLYNTKLFANTILLTGKETGYDGRHEIIFLIPAMESIEKYTKITTMISNI